MFFDYIRLAVRNILHRKKRSWLTMIGILIGITAVVALISIGQSLQRAIDKQFEEFGHNIITITPGSARGGFQGGFSTRSISLDLETIKPVEGVETVGAMLFKHAYVKAGAQAQIEGFLPVLGLSPAMKDLLGGFEVESGRAFNSDDKFKAVLGSAIMEDLSVKLGDEISVEGKQFEVIGVLKEAENSPMQTDDGILVPIETLRELFGEQGKVSFVLARAKDGLDVEEVADRIEEELERARDKDDFSVQTVEQFRELIENAIGIVQAFLAGIAGISLLVGAIGVMNTMYTAVLERTREIGIMKAVGARNGQIMILFLIESGFMGLVGGAIGIVIGFGISNGAVLLAKRFIEGADFLEASLSPGLIIGALLFSFLIGALSGLFPARNAAKLKPVEALRYE